MESFDGEQTKPSFANQPPKLITSSAQIEHMLSNAVLMTEMGMELREKCNAAEKYIYYLRSLAVRTSRSVNSLQATGRSTMLLAQTLVTTVLASIDDNPMLASLNSKLEFEKLLSIIEKELKSSEDFEVMVAGTPNMRHIIEKIKQLEARHRSSDNSLLPQSSSTKSVKSDIDEKYPENLSRDSLIDLDNVINLPTVPEDIFTSFSNKPTRTSSLSSLKSMRKVKLFLQRASTNNSDDEDDSSEPDDHEFSKPSVSSIIHLNIL